MYSHLVGFRGHRSLASMAQMADGVTCMAFTVSFVPNTGNRYFLAAADENLRLYDFEKETVRSSFWLVGRFILSACSKLLIFLSHFQFYTSCYKHSTTCTRRTATVVNSSQLSTSPYLHPFQRRPLLQRTEQRKPKSPLSGKGR